MKNKFSKTIWIVMFLAFLSSCGSGKFESPVDFDNAYMNNQIKIFAPQEFNSFSITDAIIFEVEYHSNSEIIFPNNYNVKIFKQSNNQWGELKEKPALRLSEDDIVFSATTDGIQIFAVEPDLDDYTRDSKLRFYIFGDMKTDEGITKVSAYVDVVLHP